MKTRVENGKSEKMFSIYFYQEIKSSLSKIYPTLIVGTIKGFNLSKKDKMIDNNSWRGQNICNMNIDTMTIALFIAQGVLNGSLQEIGIKTLDKTFDKVKQLFITKGVDTAKLTLPELTDEIKELLTTNQNLKEEVEIIKQDQQTMQIITNNINKDNNYVNKTYNHNSKDMSNSTFNNTTFN